MQDVSECHDLGAASYLVKPVGFAALSDVLRNLDLRWALLPAAEPPARRRESSGTVGAAG